MDGHISHKRLHVICRLEVRVRREMAAQLAPAAAVPSGPVGIPEVSSSPSDSSDPAAPRTTGAIVEEPAANLFESSGRPNAGELIAALTVLDELVWW